MKKELPFSGHEKPAFFCASAVPGELTQPLLNSANAPASTETTTQRIEHAYPSRPEPFDQEADDPRLHRRR